MILVSDTSVLIDLERGGFLDAIFTLPHGFAVPDVLLSPRNGRRVGRAARRAWSACWEVSEQGVASAFRYRQQRAKLSVPDSLALALAKEREWPLLTGDGDLRELAAGENVECHGVLWLLDLMEETGMPGIQLLHDGLETMASHPRCRLPRREITVRLERYRTVIGQE